MESVNILQRNILVLGNGFDLYHGLPTGYGDFLDFIKDWDIFYNEYKSYISHNSSSVKQSYSELLDSFTYERNITNFAKFHRLYDEENIESFNSLIKSNSWIEYLLESSYRNKGWIDFESEIENVILYFKQVISYTNKGAKPPIYNDKMNIFAKYVEYVNLSQYSGHRVIGTYMNGNIVDAKSLLNNLKKELNNLISCLNIYLLEFVNHIRVLKLSSDISKLKISKIISFNYTNTYEKIYNYDKDILEIHHIHGKIGNENNMVLGMKDDKIEENELDYVYFLKYFQRIQKKTGNSYKKWINQSDNPANNFFIFGHSLDESDKDILKDIIKANDTLQVTIFYRDQLEMEKFIINLMNIFTKDEMIKYTSDELIVFKQLID
ncbi:hypothetical protein TPDSL_22680 [Terrisporobacter petrolearius]|uniref:AbiH family protein n=1 Tax=Terrisporobacter petrolearius TaxID=1460447 RepID=UPI00336802A3